MAIPKTKPQERKEEFFTRQMSCELTDEERAKKGAQLGRAVEELAIAKSSAKQDAAVHKSAIVAQQKEVERLARILRDGAEDRPVRCQKIIDFRQAQVTVTRVDTGDVLEERGLHDYERQTELPEADGKPASPFGDDPVGEDDAA